MPKKKKYIHWSQTDRADEIRKKISETKKGTPNKLKGKKLPKDWAERCAEGRRRSGMYNCVWNKGLTHQDSEGILAGKDHYAWKGNDVGRVALHSWIYRTLGAPMECQCCGKECKNNKQIHWANKSGKYKRRYEDWIRLCVSCHKRYDMKRYGKAKLELPCVIN